MEAVIILPDANQPLRLWVATLDCLFENFRPYVKFLISRPCVTQAKPGPPSNSLLHSQFGIIQALCGSSRSLSMTMLILRFSLQQRDKVIHIGIIGSEVA